MMVSLMQRCLGEWREDRRLGRIFTRYQSFTMVNRKAYLMNLRLVKSVADVPGCVVECGVWRGGMIAGMVEVLGPDRRYVLFDSFQGLPKPKEIDGPAALEWQANTSSPLYFDNCSAPQSAAEEAMRLSRAKHVQICPGWFDDTVTGFTPLESIAVLRLDGDWYDSTMTCLTHLFPHMSPGGIVIVDDYPVWDGCSRAVHDYLSATKSTARVSQFDNDICYLRVSR